MRSTDTKPEQYEAVITEFLDTRSLRKTAERTGHTFRTVKRIVEEGDGPDRPSAYEQIEQQAAAERLRLARQLEAVERLSRDVYARLFAKLAPALAELDVHLGPIRDLRAAREAVATLRALAELGAQLHGEPEPAQTKVSVSVHRQQAMAVDPVAAREAALAIMAKHSELFARVMGTPAEGEFVAALAAEASRRQSLVHVQEEEDD